MKTEKTAEAFAAETISARLLFRLSCLPFLSRLPQAALLCALLALGAAAPLSQTRAQVVTALQLQEVLPAAIDVSDGSANVTLIISADAVSDRTATVNLSVMDVTESIGSGALPASRFSFAPAQVELPVSASIQRHEVVLTYESGTSTGRLTRSTHVLELTVTAVGASPDTGELTLADVDAITENLPFESSYSVLRHRLSFTGSEPYEGGEMFTVSVEWEWDTVNDEVFGNLLRENPAKAQAAVDEIIAYLASADPSLFFPLRQIPFAAQGYVYRLEWSGDISLQSDPMANNPDFMNGRGTEGAQNSGANYFEINVPQAATAPETCDATEAVCDRQELVSLVFTVDADAQGKAFFYPTNAVFTQPASGDQDLINALTLLGEQVTDKQLTPAPVEALPPVRLQLTIASEAFAEADDSLMMVSFLGELQEGETLTVTLSVLDDHDSDTDADLTLSQTSVDLTNTQRTREVDVTATNDALAEARETVRISAVGRGIEAMVTPTELDVTIGWNDYAVQTLALTPPMVTLGGTFQAAVTLNAAAPAGSEALEVMLIARHNTAADETTTVRVVEGSDTGSSRDWELETAGTWTVEVISDPFPDFDSFTTDVDASTASVTAQAQTLEITPPAPSIMRENLELFAPGTGAGSGASARHTQAEIRTYGTLSAEEHALQLVFRFTDADGNTDIALMPDEITVDRVEIRREPGEWAGDVLTLASNPVVSLTSSPGYFVLTADRVTGGGEENSDPRGTTLTVTVAGETFVGFATGFMTNVISNLLVDADENMPAYFEPDPLLAGETAHLRLRYRALGCVDPANPTAESCEPDRNADVAVDTGELNVSCSNNNCGLPTFVPPLNPSRQVDLVKSATDGSFYSVDIQFIAPAPTNPNIATQFIATWDPGAEGGSATNSPLMKDTASRMASAALVQDTVSPTPHADGLRITETQPYQFRFAWSTATDTITDTGEAEELSDPSAYSILYAERTGFACSADLAYTAGNAAPVPAASLDGEWTAVLADAFDGSEKIQADTAYCFVLEVTDGITTPARTMPTESITPSFLITLDADDDGLPDHLEPVCSVCDGVTNKAGDDDGDGINNVLEAYLAEESGVSSGAPSDDRDAYSDTDSNNIPDILDLQYGAFDDRTTVPSVPSSRRLICHADMREIANPQTFCTGVPSGARLLIEMDAADGDGVYQSHDGATLGALASGTHWLLNGGQLTRLDIRPRVTLSNAPMSIEVTGLGAVATTLNATVEGFYPLGSASGLELDYSLDGSSAVPGASVAPPTRQTIEENAQRSLLTINLLFSSVPDDEDAMLQLVISVANAETAPISDESFAAGSTTRLLTIPVGLAFVGLEDITLSAGMNTTAQLDLSTPVPTTQALEFIVEDLGDDGLGANLNGRSIVFTLDYSSSDSEAETAARLSALAGSLMRVREGEDDLRLADYAVDPDDSSRFIPQANLTGALIENGESAVLRLVLRLNNPTGMVEGDWLRVSLDPDNVTPDPRRQPDRLRPG